MATRIKLALDHMFKHAILEAAHMQRCSKPDIKAQKAACEHAAQLEQEQVNFRAEAAVLQAAAMGAPPSAIQSLRARYNLPEPS